MKNWCNVSFLDFFDILEKISHFFLRFKTNIW